MMVLLCVLVPELSSYRYDVANLELGPTPPSGGFFYNEAAGFVCVDSASPGVCLDPDRGTVGAHPGFRFGAEDEVIGIRAIGLHYDKTCVPN